MPSAADIQSLLTALSKEVTDISGFQITSKAHWECAPPPGRQRPAPGPNEQGAGDPGAGPYHGRLVWDFTNEVVVVYDRVVDPDEIDEDAKIVEVVFMDQIETIRFIRA